MINKKEVYGMIHLSPDNNGDRLSRALKEIEILEQEGVHGIIVENYHGSVSDIRDVLLAISKMSINMKIGINILPNSYKEALIMANEFNLDFIQLDYVSGNYKSATPIDHWEFLEYRKSYPHIKIMGGVHPKYYTPIDGSILELDIDVAKLKCDAIVVTGSGTGQETPLDKIKLFKECVDNFPLIVGAGVNMDNVIEQLSICNGAIVGSCFKPYGRTDLMIDQLLVHNFMQKVKSCFNE